MTKAEIKARQQTLRDAGFDVAIDGVEGDSTRKAWETYQSSQARVDQARAAAEGAKATAEAERARSEAEAIRARAELARQESDAKKRIDEAAEKQRAFDRELQDRADKEAREAREGLRKAGINAAALGAGLYGGLVYAKQIDAHRTTAVNAAAPKLATLAKETRTVIKQYEAGKNVPAAAKKLRGIVNAADKAKFTARAPLGIGPAFVLAVEGAISRYIIAPQFEDPTAREAFQALGTTSAVAATTIIGKGAVNVATPSAPVNGRDLAAIESARTIADAEAKAVRAKTVIPRGPRSTIAAALNKAKPGVKLAGGAGALAIAGPAVVALTAYDSTKSAALAEGAGEGAATARAAGTAALVGGAVAAGGIAIAKGIMTAARAVAKALPAVGAIGSKAGPVAMAGFAGYAGYEGYKAGGVPGAAMGVADSVTMGGLSLLNEKARAALLPNDGKDRAYHAPRSGRAYLNAQAADRSQAERRAAPVTATRSSNGWVEGYLRSNGVRVEGYRRAA
jgi:hypothetical protein